MISCYVPNLQMIWIISTDWQPNYFFFMRILNKNREWHETQTTGSEILFIDFYDTVFWSSSHHDVSIIGGILWHDRSDCPPDSHGGI